MALAIMSFSDLANMFGQLQGIQKKFTGLQEEVKNMQFTVETGGGMVKATVDGQGSLIDLKINASLLEPDELPVLPELIRKAIQEAQKKSKEGAAEKIKELSGVFGSIPGLDQLFR